MSKSDRKYKKPWSPLPSKVTEKKPIPGQRKFCKLSYILIEFRSETLQLLCPGHLPL